MTSDLNYATQPEPALAPKPLRLWPVLLLLALYWAFRVWSRQTTDLVMFVRFGSSFLAAVGVALVFVCWWLISRRVPRPIKWPAFGAFLLAGVATALLMHASLHPMSLLMFAPPWVVTVWAVWLLASRRFTPRVQRAGLVTLLCLAWGFFTLVRFDGMSGEQAIDLSWRWSPTPEQRDLATLDKSAAARKPLATTAPLTATPADWPAFRGPHRDSVARHQSILTDWPAAGPRQLWRRPSGPGWSSFALVGDRAYTQEQRGDHEAVLCLDARDGTEIWAHQDPTRFAEGVSGAGPRATPTFADGRLYTLGATGLLNCLDPADGKVLWSRDVRAHADAPLPQWGFSSSPLVAAGVVVVYAGGPGDKGVVAYRAADGQPAWNAPAGPHSYASAQLVTLHGREQLLFLSDTGLASYDPATGKPIWDYPAPAKGAPRSIQPQALGNSQVLISSEMDIGTALLDVTRDGDHWSATRRWATRHLKPSFNDFVVHHGHAYGFDGTVFTCVDLTTGQRKWREGNYGHGQVLLVEDQSLLLIVSEEGDLLLHPASPDAPNILHEFKAVQGKVWAHPALAHGRLIVRSDRETACFELGTR